MNIEFKASVEKDLRKNLLLKIRTELAYNPGMDKQLKGEYKELYSYRVGNYRVIYTILTDSILILHIGHRKDVYE